MLVGGGTNMLTSNDTGRRRFIWRAGSASTVLGIVLLTAACQADRPFVATDDVAAQKDQDTVDALNDFMAANGGLRQWKDHYDDGPSRPAPYTELTGYGVCSNRDALGFPDGDVGDRGR